MKKLTFIFVTVAICMVGLTLAQSSDWTIRQVRDPVQMREKLNTDGAAIETRFGQVEALGITNTTYAVTVGSLTTTGAVTVANGAISSVAIATNTLGAKTVTLVDAGVSTNVLYFSAQGILTNATSNP